MKRTKFATIADLKFAVRNARDEAKAEAQKSCGRGFLMSRGASFVVTRKDGAEPDLLADYVGFEGTAKQVEKILDQYLTDQTAGVFIEGGFNFAATLADYKGGAYDPWVSEWSVQLC